MANAGAPKAESVEPTTFTNAIARGYADAGYDDFAAVVEAGHACAACHLTHFINRIPENSELDLERYQEVASGARRLRMVVELVATGFMGVAMRAEGLTVSELQALRTSARGSWADTRMRLFQAGDLYGVEPATEQLLVAVRAKGRTVVIAEAGSEELRMLDYFGAEASVGGEAMDHIILRANPSKPALLEEFLHGAQHRLGIVERLGQMGAEAHVKGFMIRHARLLGLVEEDVAILRVLHGRDLVMLRAARGGR